MKTITKTMAISLMLLAFPVSGIAEENINPWTKCGIGAMIFKETPAAAVISNVIWDLGTTAVTSAGLSRQTCEGKDVTTASFIYNSYSYLEEETVKGDGQHLRAMLNIRGCDASTHNSIIDNVRTDFSSVIQSNTYSDSSTLDRSITYYDIVGARTAHCEV